MTCAEIRNLGAVIVNKLNSNAHTEHTIQKAVMAWLKDSQDCEQAEKPH